MRNKARFEFVDEFRKINCLQKLLPVDNLHPDDEDEVKPDNNKFIRYKEELILEEEERDHEYLFNPIISNYKDDIEPDCRSHFQRNLSEITQDIDYYKQWSQTLNQEVRQRDYTHKFFFQQAAPPPRLKEEGVAKEKTGGRGDNVEPDRQEQHDAGIDLPQRGKYNFHEITKHLYNNRMEGEDKDGGFLRDLTIKNEIAELRKLKGLEQIQKIGDFHQELGKFSYYIEAGQEQNQIEFVDNSIVRGNNTLAIDYFRDIGTPSRRILEYTLAKERRMRGAEVEEGDLGADYRQEGRQLLYLYFLKEEELKINKNEMTFADMANLAMGRITAKNAQRCVRSQKVTQAQYNKLLKKMEKYDLRENETGKPKEDKLVGTEELQEITQHNPNAAEQPDPANDREDKNNIEKLIDQINKIRKEVKLIEDKASVNTFNRSAFNNQVYSRLERLLTHLYDIVTEKMPQKCSLADIGQHLHQIEGTNDLGYDRLRILWFVANCYDQLLSKQEKTIDLRSLASAKPVPTPQLAKYKGSKLLTQGAIQTKKLFGFPKSDQPRTRTPIKSTLPLGQNNRTPTKDNNRTPTKQDSKKTPIKQTNRTPLKQTGTGSKMGSYQATTTGKKYAMTAKK